MKRLLIDSKNNIIYEGEDSKSLLSVLLAEPEDISEEDELKFEDQLRNLKWIGDLRYEVHFDLKFRGFDDWDRPVFKDIDSGLYFGSVNHLRGSQPDVIEHLKLHPYELEYFGDTFNCEPHGGRQEFFKFKIIE